LGRGGQTLKFEDFRKSKWVKAARDSRAESRLRAAFPKWKSRVKDLNLISRAGELWGYFVSGRCSAGDKLLVMGALIYLVSPIDLIPDYIPVIGWLDDVGVATAVLAYLNGKLDEAIEIENTGSEFLENTRRGDTGEHSGAGDDPFEDLMTETRPTVGDDPYSGLFDDSRTGDDPFADLFSDRPSRK
jgi:uncharacterized membrane protein YkvA (DUF1232 family)